MMEKTDCLPPALEEKICETLADDQSWSALTNCALVSRRWLHHSRRHHISRLRISLNVEPYSKSERLLQELLFQPIPRCTLWPHIIDLRVSHNRYSPYFDHPPDIDNTSPTFLHILSLSLTHASSLRTLHLNGFCFFGLPSDIVSRFTSINSLTSITLCDTKFLSPGQLINFLGSLPSLRIRCRLGPIYFIDQDWDSPVECRFSADPSLQFNITAGHDDNLVLLKTIIHNSWNVTELLLEAESSNMAEQVRLQDALQHVGSSLKKLNFPLRDIRDSEGILQPIDFTLKHNASLEELHLGTIADFQEDAEIPSAIRFSSFLATISSRKLFKSLTGYLSFYSGKEDDDGDRGLIKAFEWDLIEDILMNKERFPGEGPTFTLRFIDGSDWSHGREVVAELIASDCIPRLAEAGKLDFMTFF